MKDVVIHLCILTIVCNYVYLLFVGIYMYLYI